MHFFKFISLGGAMLLLPLKSIMAQQNWEPSVQEQYVLLQDNCNANNFQDAYRSYQWLINKVPELHENLYIFGTKAIKELYKDCESDSTKRSLFYELNKAYDLRIKNFGDSQNIILRKAMDLYSLGASDPDILMLKLKTFDTALNWNNRDISSNMLVAYMDLICDGYKAKQLSEDETIARYIKIQDAFAKVATTGEEGATTERHKAICDNMFINLISLNCEQIDEKFARKFSQSHSLELAKIIVKLSLAYRCSGSTYFIDALKLYYDAEPTYSIASFLGSKMKDKGDLKLAHKYFSDMFELAGNAEEKAQSYLSLAALYAENNKELSRSYIIKALAFQPQMKPAYVMWGDLYYYSFNQCKKEESQVVDRSVYLAAYDKYKLAGNTEKMKLAAQQFPLIDDIHFENYKEGETITCHCWINEEVEVKRRVH